MGVSQSLLSVTTVFGLANAKDLAEQGMPLQNSKIFVLHRHLRHLYGPIMKARAPRKVQVNRQVSKNRSHQQGAFACAV
jgi:hypothetical protein